MRRLLLLSTSTLHGSGYLEYAAEAISKFLKDAEVTKVLFFPFALHDQDGYANKAKSAFSNWGFELESIHTKDDPVVAVKEAQAFFVGGGNTFRLLNTLYKLNLVEAVRERVLTHGVPYIGSSAGTNVATISICTTNDMPIVYPPSFKAFGLVPFNINPHYIDAHPEKHMGETREERIAQYHEQLGTPPVLGLREGSYLEASGDTIILRGPFPARLFRRDEPAKELDPNSDLSFLSKC